MVLFFDPGPSTGIAVVDGDSVLFTTVVRNASDDELEDIAASLAEKYAQASVGIEAPPMLSGNMRPVTQRIEEILRKHFQNARWVRPSDWKNTPSARTKVPSNLTQHEKDAVRAGRWMERVGG